ncbi:MAG: hypothetical protein R3F65_27485, partial [bacterium]
VDVFAARQNRVQAGRDFEQYVRTALRQRWRERFDRVFAYHPPPLDIEMQYYASASMGGAIDAFPVDPPAGAPARIVRREPNRRRYADGFIASHPGTHQRGVMIEAKCLNPYLEFDARNHAWARIMQVGFVTQLHDYLAFANDTWRARRAQTPPIRVQYYFCDFIPRWAGLLMAAALAQGAPAGYFGEPQLRFGPPDNNWVRSPVWYPDALGLADAVGSAVENWEGFIPWSDEGGDWMMNITGSIYDQLSGSE